MYSNPREHEVDCEAIRKYDPQGVLDRILSQSKWRLEKEALQVRDYRDTRKYLADLYPDRGRLLEIGSGLGYLLDSFRKDGWTALGVEPNEGLCRYAQQVLGADVIPGTLEDAKLEAASLDAALMIHVIEHVPDPAAVLKDVFRLLKPGGTFVVETPRYDTLMFRLLGKRERSLSCDGHIYFFTSTTLKKMALTAGFDVSKIDFVGRSLTADRLLYVFGHIAKSKALEARLHQVSERLRLNKITMTLNVRDMQRLYLRKPLTAA
jgi:2-polyprenyl-3-methyl-5-hydroxy-6-metoxy-1,4-benzoquinol methylase